MTVSLEDLAGGALQENASKAIEEVIKNMQDPNTPWKNKRVVTIKLAFTQNEDRDDATCDISVEKKLAAVKPVETKLSIGKDLKTGKVYMQEYGPGVKGQMSFEDLDSAQNNIVVDGKNVDAETGEIQDGQQVVDFRKVKEG